MVDRERLRAKRKQDRASSVRLGAVDEGTALEAKVPEIRYFSSFA